MDNVPELSALRAELDEIDARLTEQFAQRMEVCARIARVKGAAALPVLDAERERQKLAQVRAQSPEPLREYAEELYALLLELSRRYQRRMLDREEGPV